MGSHHLIFPVSKVLKAAGAGISCQRYSEQILQIYLCLLLGNLSGGPSDEKLCKWGVLFLITPQNPAPELKYTLEKRLPKGESPK